MNTENMNLYCIVYETGNIARAAETLFTSHQAISKRVRAIEKELGVALFERSVKGLAPTKAGQDAYHTFKSMLDAYRKLQGRLGESSGSRPIIRLGIEFYDIDIIDLEGILAFERTAPENPRIQVKYLSNMDCYRQLLSDTIDVAITNRPFVNPEKFKFISVNKSRGFFAVSEKSPLATKKLLEPADFDGQTLLSIIDAENSNRAIVSQFEDAGIKISVDEVAYDMSSLAGIIRTGRGFHVLPEVYTDPLLRHPGIAVRLLPGMRDVFEIGIVRARNHPLNAINDAFVSFIASNPSIFAKKN